jgi:hypothetical protein
MGESDWDLQWGMKASMSDLNPPEWLIAVIVGNYSYIQRRRLPLPVFRAGAHDEVSDERPGIPSCICCHAQNDSPFTMLWERAGRHPLEESCEACASYFAGVGSRLRSRRYGPFVRQRLRLRELMTVWTFATPFFCGALDRLRQR